MRSRLFALLLGIALVTAPSLARSDPPAALGYLCVGANQRFKVEACGGRFHAVGVPGQKSPPCTDGPPVVQHFKVGESPWFEAPAKGHRCVALPVGKKVWFHIKEGQSWKQAVDADCKSRAMDLHGPNAYAATFFLCAKTRDRSRDELVATVR